MPFEDQPVLTNYSCQMVDRFQHKSFLKTMDENHHRLPISIDVNYDRTTRWKIPVFQYIFSSSHKKYDFFKSVTLYWYQLIPKIRTVLYWRVLQLSYRIGLLLNYPSNFVTCYWSKVISDLIRQMAQSMTWNEQNEKITPVFWKISFQTHSKSCERKPIRAAGFGKCYRTDARRTWPTESPASGPRVYMLQASRHSSRWSQH